MLLELPELLVDVELPPPPEQAVRERKQPTNKTNRIKLMVIALKLLLLANTSFRKLSRTDGDSLNQKSIA